MLPTAVVTFGAGDVTCLIESATIRHGRDDPTSQPDASAATFEILGPLPAGVDIGTAATISAILAGSSYPRFTGTITDIAIGWDTPDSPVCQLIAVGALASMGYRIAGDVAYPSESDGARANRAITVAGVPTDGARTDPGTLQVLARAADPQPALQVAQDAAEDGAGYIWQAKDGAVLYADADHRRASSVALALDACTMPLEVTWTKNLEGLSNDVRVSWGDGDTTTGGDTDGTGDGTGGGAGTTSVLFKCDPFAIYAAGAQTRTLTYVPRTDSEHVYLNGVEQDEDTDWTRTDQTLYVLAAMDARAGDLLEVRYAHTGEVVVPPDVLDAHVEYADYSVATGYLGSAATITVPSGAGVDDMLVLATRFPIAQTLPGLVDWTLVESVADSIRATRVYVRPASEVSGSIAMTPTSLGDWRAAMVAYSGVDLAAPVGDSDTATSATAPAVTTTRAGEQVLRIWGQERNFLAPTFTPPAGVTQRAVSGGVYALVAITDETAAGPGTSATRTATGDTTEWTSVSLVLAGA